MEGMIGGTWRYFDVTFFCVGRFVMFSTILWNNKSKEEELTVYESCCGY
jgi:hypothetical protein